MIGKTIHHYKILEELGSGGMGTVYKAQDTKLDRLVALKFLAPHLSRDENEKERFIREAKAISALDHPNICSIFEINETDDGQLYIAMACYQGKSLQEIIKEGRLPVDQVIEIVNQIAEGLAVAHSKNIIHRDIKPANILLTEEGKVKIVDFGLAKLAGKTVLTKDGSIMGTTAYMSPEQIKGAEVDNRTDIWAFGIVLYEMLTGELPFKGEYDQAIMYLILNEEPQFADDIDPSLKKTIIQSLKKNPDDRYQNVGEIAEELNKTTKSLPSSRAVNETESIKTIAVLPFVNMSPDPNQEYFSDGISEELINKLSKNPKLRVTARTSSFYFKGKNVNIKTIAQTLNVKHILEGSVRKSGNNLRISTDLVNAETEATLWSNTYDGTMNNIFALQDSISGNVAEALKAALLGKEAARPERKTDPVAYNLYLLGNRSLYLGGKKNVERAIGYYERAISIDSSFALAWLGLGRSHIHQAVHYIPPINVYPKGLKELKKAIELNPSLAQAYSLMGAVKFSFEYSWTEARVLINRALELEPKNPNVLMNASALDFVFGDFNKAIILVKRSLELDPVNAFAYQWLGGYYLCAGHLDEAIISFKKCIELNNEQSNYANIGLVYLVKGKLDSALVEIQKEKDLKWETFGFAIVYYALGRKKEADEKLQQYIKEYQDGWAFQIAQIYAFRGEKDKAFEWLERAYKQRDSGLAYMVGDPLLRNIVKDPRYEAFMKKMNLPL